MTIIHTGNTTTTGFSVTSDTNGELVIKTGGAGGTTAITIDNAQVATFANPLINDLPLFETFLTTTQNITSNQFTLLNFDNVNFDSHSWFDTANYRYTPQMAGYYIFTAAYTMTPSTSASVKLVALYKNGVLAKYLEFTRYAAVAGTTTASGSSILYMNGTTDYVDVYAYTLGTGTLAVSSAASQTYFQGYLLKRDA